MEFHKFIKIKKNGQIYYYLCPNVSNTAESCYNYMRSDINRVLLNNIPTNYSLINCTDVTSTTTSTSTSSTTSSTTSSSTTKKPCLVRFESVSFVNNSSFPYDYQTKQGYIEIKMKAQTGVTYYQFKIMSGNNVIKDWTSAVSQNTVMFKLNSATYTILVRDYNDINCTSSISNIIIPSLNCDIIINSVGVVCSNGQATATVNATSASGKILRYGILGFKEFQTSNVFQIGDSDNNGYSFIVGESGNEQNCNSQLNKVIKCQNPNHAPIAIDDTFSTTKGKGINNTVATNDSDPDSDPLTYSIVATPENGTVLMNSDGSFSYAPNATFIGIDTFEYKVCDNGTPPLCDNGIVSITVTEQTTVEYLFPACAVFVKYQNNVYYDDIDTNDGNNAKILVNNLPIDDEIGMTLYNGNLYLPHKSNGTYRVLSVASRTSVVKQFVNFTPSTHLLSGEKITAMCNDSDGNFYINTTHYRIHKFNKNNNDWVYGGLMYDLKDFIANHSDLTLNDISVNEERNSSMFVYIPNINSVLLNVYIGEFNSTTPATELMITVKLDNSFLLTSHLSFGLNKMNEHYYFVKNNSIESSYKVNGNNQAPYIYNKDGFTNITDVSYRNLPEKVQSSTQNNQCKNVDLSFNINLKNMIYTCTSSTTFSYEFDIFDGSGNYSYSVDGYTYTQINGTKFSKEFQTGSVYQVLLKDNVKNKIYYLIIKNPLDCSTFETSSTTSTTSSTTTQQTCVMIYDYSINGYQYVVPNETKSYGFNFSGTPPLTYEWSCDGGQVINGKFTQQASITWDDYYNGQRKISCKVYLCNGEDLIVNKNVFENV